MSGMFPEDASFLRGTILSWTPRGKLRSYYLHSKYKRIGAVTNGKSSGTPRKFTWRAEK